MRLKSWGGNHTFKVHPYKGIGRIPKNLSGAADPNKRVLLEQLPKLLSGYGRAYPKGRSDYRIAIIVICDLDNRCLVAFKNELNRILSNCNPQPETRFCIAVEEGEAWFLGDIPAIKQAYPKVDARLLSQYQNDSICGTWEYLAKVIGERRANKGEWAEKITPHMDIEQNQSPSFNYLRKKIQELIN